jgi:hypothetical protein
MDFEYDEDGMSAIVGQVEKIVEFVTLGIARRARANCPTQTGDLKSTITPVRNKVYVGGPKAPYWYFPEFGTDPHDILPKTKKALFWPTALHPVSMVHHPGTPELAYMRNALYNNQWLTAVLP